MSAISQKTKSLELLHQQASIGLAQTLTLFTDLFDPLFKSFGITAVQFNVLRILRGAGDEGLGRNEIRDRLLNRMPDVTRLLDRMEDAKLIVRKRNEEDRRVVPTFITQKGRELLEKVNPVLVETHHQIFGQMTRQQLEQLLDLLALIRNRPR